MSDTNIHLHTATHTYSGVNGFVIADGYLPPFIAELDTVEEAKGRAVIFLVLYEEGVDAKDVPWKSVEDKKTDNGSQHHLWSRGRQGKI